METRKSRYNKQWTALEDQRSSFLAHWRELGEYFMPRRPRFTLDDVNKGDRRSQKIIDSTGTFAMRTLASGMQAGVTSPARAWFNLTTPDPGLAEFGPVKMWLDAVTQRMRTVKLRSNFYQVTPGLYADLGIFATGAVFIEEDFERVVRYYGVPVGSYLLGNDSAGRVNTFMRQFRMTVRQVVERFGTKTKSGLADWSKFSMAVKNDWDRGNYQRWVDVRHCVQPNDEYMPGRLMSKHKRFTSCYWELGGNDGEDRFLSERGYDYFPVLAARWHKTGEDVWGTDSPGIVALGDVKALQVMQKRRAQAVDKMVNPPLQAPVAMRNTRISMLPGDLTYNQGSPEGIRPVHEVNINLQHLREDILETRELIKKACYADLFLMLSEIDRREITATEIAERKEEKLLALGPVLEQLNQDVLDPDIDLTFEFMVRQGLVPPPPKELQNTTLKVEYVSIMAQAQKLVGVSVMERFAGFVAQAATVNPAVLDKVDYDQLVDEYGNQLSVPASVVRTDEAVAQMRQVKAQAVQAQAQAEQMQALGKTAQTLSQTDLSKDSALSALLKQSQAGQLTPQ